MKNPANKKRRPPSARSNHTMPDTLGKVPIVVRSLRCVGGARPGPYAKHGRGLISGPRIPQAPSMRFNMGTLDAVMPVLAALFMRRGLR